MAIDFGLGLQTLQALGSDEVRRQQMEFQRQQAANQQYLFNQGKAQDQARIGLASRARGGDYTGAAQEAALTGDFDFAKAIGGVAADRHEQALAELDTLGTLAQSLKAVPQEQRAARAAPVLHQLGLGEHIENIDFSDGGLDGYYRLSAAGKAEIAAQREAAKPRVVGDGGALVDGSGKVLYENEREAKWQFDPESGSWLQQPGTGGSAGGGSPLPPASGAPEVGTFGRMIQAESGGRQFTNGRVTTSPVGATGIAQVMPTTGPEAAAAAGLPWDPNRFRNDAEYNRALGEAYYAKQLASFNGNPEAAAAAYNAGPGRTRSSGAPQTRGDWRQALPAETRAYIAKVAPGFAGRNVAATNATPGMGGQPGVVNVRPPRQKERQAPSGYQWDGNRLVPIPGGPADPATSTSRNVQSNRKAEADYRKEFDGLPEVKTFKTARSQFNTLRDLAKKPNPTPQDDIAIIFNYMKTLDPSSVVREGEFANAQNAAGIDESIRNMYNKARTGQRLNPQQRQNMVKTAYQNYRSLRDAYNTSAENFRGYARDNGINPDRVARTYTPDKPQRRPSLGVGQAASVGGIKITRVQ
jgi:hypothetical protein